MKIHWCEIHLGIIRYELNYAAYFEKVENTNFCHWEVILQAKDIFSKELSKVHTTGELWQSVIDDW